MTNSQKGMGLLWKLHPGLEIALLYQNCLVIAYIDIKCMLFKHQRCAVGVWESQPYYKACAFSILVYTYMGARFVIRVQTVRVIRMVEQRYTLVLSGREDQVEFMSGNHWSPVYFFPPCFVLFVTWLSVVCFSHRLMKLQNIWGENIDYLCHCIHCPTIYTSAPGLKEI